MIFHASRSSFSELGPGRTCLRVLKYCEVEMERSMWYHGRKEGKFQSGAKFGLLSRMSQVLIHCSWCLVKKMISFSDCPWHHSLMLADA